MLCLRVDLLCVTLGVVWGCGVLGENFTELFAAETKGAAATLSAARSVLDLPALPRIQKDKPPTNSTLARLAYVTSANPAATYAFYQKTFKSQGWTELPGGYQSEQFASGTFSKSGYTVALSAFAQGEETGVTLNNLGNIELAKLPMPKEAKTLYAGPANLMLLSSAPPAEVKENCKKLLTQAGWTPYGSAGDSLYFKQNAVRLNVTVSIAPAQQNQTAIQLQSELMSADFPAPPDAEQLQYADVTKTISFDTSLSLSELAEFYQKSLLPAGWKSTTEQPVKTDFRHFLIFRNPAGELAELTLSSVEGKTRALLKLQTAEEVAALDAAAKAAMAAAKATKSAPIEQVALSLPPGVSSKAAKPTSLELTVKSGQAQKLVSQWKKQFEKDGWKAEVGIEQAVTGSIDLKKGAITLSFIYVDPGFIDGEITVRVTGAELKLTKPE